MDICGVLNIFRSMQSKSMSHITDFGVVFLGVPSFSSVFLAYTVNLGFTGEPHLLLNYRAVTHSLLSDYVFLPEGLSFTDNQLQNFQIL